MEGALIELHRDPIQLDRAQDRLLRQRDQSLLERITNQEHIGGNRIAKQLTRIFGGVNEADIFLAAGNDELRQGFFGREVHFIVARERRDGDFLRVHDCLGAPATNLTHRRRCRDHVTSKQQVCHPV